MAYICCNGWAMPIWEIKEAGLFTAQPQFVVGNKENTRKAL
jgi:hypothetical protein